jgi:phage host-nuclease inhibitor protein Gam
MAANLKKHLHLKQNKTNIMARTKKKQYVGVTLENAQSASETFAQCNNKLKKVEAKMNGEIDKIKSKYQDEITGLKESQEEPLEMLEAFALEQKDSWGKKKSLELLHTIIGFRTGTPKVSKNKAFTWEAVTELVSKLFPNLIRTKPELDKETIIALRDQDSFKELKDTCYIDVVQDETFFVQPKEEELVAA